MKLQLKLIAALLLVAVLGLGSATADLAHAGLITCNSDPQITLSDGRVVQMSATITDSASDVYLVTYVLHVPPGVYATNIVGDNSGIPDSAVVVSDLWGSDSEGYATAKVLTGSSNVPVTFRVTVQNGATNSRSGYSGQTLYVHL